MMISLTASGRNSPTNNLVLVRRLCSRLEGIHWATIVQIRDIGNNLISTLYLLDHLLFKFFFRCLTALLSGPGGIPVNFEHKFCCGIRVSGVNLLGYNVSIRNVLFDAWTAARLKINKGVVKSLKYGSLINYKLKSILVQVALRGYRSHRAEDFTG